MTSVSQYLAPIIGGFFVMFIILWVCFIFYNSLKLKIMSLKFFIKHKVFRKKFDEDLIMYAIETIELDKRPLNEIQKEFLLMGESLKDVQEFAYIYKMVMKKKKKGHENEQILEEMKGGKKNEFKKD